MTSRERAVRAISNWKPGQSLHHVVTHVEQAIVEAVRDEREACANIAVDHAAAGAAVMIRKRGQQ